MSLPRGRCYPGGTKQPSAKSRAGVRSAGSWLVLGSRARPPPEAPRLPGYGMSELSAAEEIRKIPLSRREEESCPPPTPGRFAVCPVVLHPDGDTAVQRDGSFSVQPEQTGYQLGPLHWLFLLRFCITKLFPGQQGGD